MPPVTTTTFPVSLVWRVQTPHLELRHLLSSTRPTVKAPTDTRAYVVAAEVVITGELKVTQMERRKVL